MFFFCCVFIAVGNDSNESVMQQNKKLFMGRSLDWKQISAMFRLTWLSGVLFSWKIHTDSYRVEMELISSNCGLCCFTSPVWLQVSPSLSRPLSLSPSPSLGSCILINIKHTDTHTHTNTHTCSAILRNCNAQTSELASSWLFSVEPETKWPFKYWISTLKTFKGLYGERCAYKCLSVTAQYTGKC